MLNLLGTLIDVDAGVARELKDLKRCRIQRLKRTCKYCGRVMPIRRLTGLPIKLCGCKFIRLSSQRPQSPKGPKRGHARGMSLHPRGRRRQGITAN